MNLAMTGIIAKIKHLYVQLIVTVRQLSVWFWVVYNPQLLNSDLFMYH